MALVLDQVFHTKCNINSAAACQAVLDAIAKKQIHFGPVGAGAAAKVINNAVAHAVMVVVAEAGSMATASGIDCQKLIGLLSDAQMGLHRPLTYRYAERIVPGEYDGGAAVRHSGRTHGIRYRCSSRIRA